MAPLDVWAGYTYNRRMVRINLYVTERQLAALQKESRRSGLSVAELVRRALDAILKGTV